MTRDRSSLPEGMEIASRFAKPESLQEWFISGVHDGIDDMGLPDREGFDQSHEPGAWEAFQAGYEAGRRWRRERPDPLYDE